MLRVISYGVTSRSCGISHYFVFNPCKCRTTFLSCTFIADDTYQNYYNNCQWNHIFNRISYLVPNVCGYKECNDFFNMHNTVSHRNPDNNLYTVKQRDGQMKRNSVHASFAWNMWNVTSNTWLVIQSDWGKEKP